MLHLWVIALFVALVLRDSLDAPLLAGWVGLGGAALWTLGVMTAVGGAAHLIVRRSTGMLLRTGSWRAVLTAETTLGTARWVAAWVHIVAVVCLGWLDAVRAVIGDIVVFDEAVAMTPPVVVFAWGWWAMWPMERMLRDATMVRQLDDGLTVYPMPARATFALLNLRHHVFVWLTPLLLILAWTEAWNILIPWLSGRGGVFAALQDEQTLELVGVGTQLMGVALVFLALGPLAMRFVWDTVRMPEGGLREELVRMCRRYGVRVREILVWRTHGTMVNGAVLGLTPAFRYVLLTDALLDTLPDVQVEAVMAHEVAHVRHRHIIWLAVILGVTITGSAWAAEAGLLAMGLLSAQEEAPAAAALGVAGVSLLAAMVVFGVVSRRFEWEADAFAAAHMSERLRMLDAPGDAGAPVVTRDGAGAMQAALRSVATLSHVAIERKSFRHGSIASRLDRLGALVGEPSGRVPINATSRRIKYGAIVALAVLVGLGAWQLSVGG